MAYDENDFQNQNFQLAGEDHQFPANLNALSLPNFGLDEHLRFDSLAETEGLLGIQGQASNWIEDFSPGGSAIEFSSSGAESSSIIRHKNVWLEATSSESVEMLLKSVGEDEIIDQKAVIMDSRADDGLHGMDDLLHLHVKKDETHNLTLRDFQSNDPELSQDSHLKIASDLTEDSRDFQPQFQALLQEVKVEESRIVLDATPSTSEVSSGRVIGEQNSGVENFVYQESSDVEIEKNLIMPRDDETKNQHMESTSVKSKVSIVKNSTFFDQKIVSLGMVNKKCSTILSVNSDGLLDVVACPDKFLNGDVMICDEVCGKEEYSGSLVKNDNSNNKNNPGEISAEAKVPDLTDGFKTTGCRQYGFIEDDDVHMRECLSNKSSNIFFIGGGILGTCMSVEEKQEPDDKEAVNTNKDVGVPPHLLRESYISPHIDYDTQAIDTEEYHFQENNGEKKSETIVLDSLAENMVVDMPEMVKLETDEAVAQDKSSVPAAISDVELKVLHSTPCKSFIRKEAQDLPSGDWMTTEVSSFVDPSAKKLLQEELAMSFQKTADLQQTNLDDSSDMDVIGQQKESLTQGLHVSHTTHSDAKNVEMSAVSSSLLKIALGSEKASDPALVFHPVKVKGTLPEEMSQDYLDKSTSSPLSQAIVGVSLAMGQKENQLSCLDVLDSFDFKDVNLTIEREGQSSCFSVLDSVESNGNGMKLYKEEKGSNSRKSVDEETLNRVDTTSAWVEDASLGATIESHPIADMEPSPLVQSSDCNQCQNDVPSFIGETVGNGSSIQSGAKDTTHDRVDTTSAWVEDASLGAAIESHPIADMEPSPLVQSSDYNQCKNDVPSFIVETVGNGGSIQSGAKDTTHDSWVEETDETINSSGAFFNGSKEAALVVSGSKDKSLLLKAQIGCQSSSVQNCGSPTIISCRGCPHDEPEHQELNESLSDCNATTSCGINLISPEKEGITGKGRSWIHDFKENDLSLEVRGFTFKVPSSENSPEKDSGCNIKSFSNLQSTENPQMSKEIHPGCPEEGEVVLVATKTPGQPKDRDTSMPSTEKEIASEVMAAKSSTGTPTNSDVTLSKDMQLVDMREHSYLECSTAKTSTSLTIHTPVLPDLNSSVSSLALFYQPLTNVQQVQLRAQIFVYGALISSIPPDEAYMVSAFGGTDGGRSLWESVWHAIVDRFSNQKSTIAGYDTPSSSSPVPSRDACRALNPTIQAASPSVLLSSTSSSTTTMTPVFPMETTKRTPNHRTSKNTHTPQKARKSKNGAATEQPSLPVSQPSRENISVASVVKSLPVLPASLPLSSNLSTKTAIGAHFSVSTAETYNNTECRVILSEETYNNIEQAKLEAEDAAALAVSAVKHSQAIWTRLDAQRNSGLVPEVEKKIASAAVSVAAAASVAKASAAAAKVASEAALQVKMMVDEAITSAKEGNANQSSENKLPDVRKQLAGLTSVSILKGKDMIHGSGAVISAAREASRRRVEAASAATKWAENLDAIVKAAELAAEAVAQAGIIIAMGDPLPFTLSGLVDSGPEDFWKAQYATSLKLAKPNSPHGDEHRGLNNVEDHGISAKQLDERFSSIRETGRTSDKGGLSSLNESHHHLEGMPQGNLPNSGNGRFNPVNNTSIQKGSLVEIMSDKDGRRGAWFSARVVDVKDNNAYVCYNDILSHGGQLKEWLALDNEEDKPPRIRRAHSTTTVKYERTRKRCREHLTNYIWAVGDHVDAWIHDGWWEGIVTEKNLGDETKLTVHFPARGDKHIIHVWDLRQSLVWQDGQWLYWSLSRKESPKPHEGDTPQKKRQRLCRLDPCGTSSQPKNITLEESRKPEESRSLILSAKKRTFSIGKHGSTTNALGITRPGLQKEGSRVVFGIPKPGKKRKFMEVSKHYIANNPEKINEGSHSIKFAKYLMPRVGHQTKNTSKVDSKGHKAGESKPNGGVKAERLQNIQTRSQTEKINSSLTVGNGEFVHGCLTNFTSSFRSNGNNYEKKNSSESGSFPRCGELTNVPAIEPDSSIQLAAAISSSKIKSAPGSKIEFTLKRKPTVGRPTKVEERGSENPGKAVCEAMDPRRSNRRIQPTSRLLEGLQSSLNISKIAGVSHERKSHKDGSSSRGDEHG